MPLDSYITQIDDTSSLAINLETVYQLPKKSWDELLLNRTGSRIPNSIGVSGINHFHIGFNWQKGDNKIPYWIPQGITGKRNGGDNATKKYLLVSWYYKKDRDPNYQVKKGVRISFVDVTDMDNIKYRHVLLVQPAQANESFLVFKPIDIHAGGIACIGNTLYVADTGKGMRAFDLTKIFQVTSDSTELKCGIIGSNAYAFDYYYILPQTKNYFLEHNKASFSWVSIDRTDDNNPKLFTGNYKDSHGSKTYDDDAIPTISWWNLSPAKEISSLHKLTSSLSLSENIQGGHVINGKNFFANSNTNKILVDGKSPQSWATEGCEDLHYSKYSGNLWSLTEYANKRKVFAVKAVDYL